MVLAALEIYAFIKQSNSPFQVRVGINSGLVVAGIVGVKKYAYDIWGDTVHTAARMEQHSVHHVLWVMERVEFIPTCKALHPEEIALIKVAALFHDSGFFEVPKNHAQMSCEIVRKQLPGYAFSPAQIEPICEMILSTKIPQSPKDFRTQVLCDADLDYLGTEDYEGLANQLHNELLASNLELGLNQWLELQINFPENHNFFTHCALEHREPLKKLHLSRLKNNRNG